MEEKEMLIKIYNQQDRLDVAQILIKTDTQYHRSRRNEQKQGKQLIIT